MASDAGISIQDVVESAIPQLSLDGIPIERKIALSYVTATPGGYTENYIKLLCFKDKDKNCYHVRIHTENGVSKYVTKTAPKMVRDEITLFWYYKFWT